MSPLLGLRFALLPALALGQTFSAGEALPITLNGFVTTITLPFSSGQGATLTIPMTFTPTPINVPGESSAALAPTEIPIIIPIAPSPETAPAARSEAPPSLQPTTTNALSVLISAFSGTVTLTFPGATGTASGASIPSSVGGASTTASEASGAPSPSVSTITHSGTTVVVPIITTSFASSVQSGASSIGASVSSQLSSGASGLSSGASSIGASASSQVSSLVSSASGISASTSSQLSNLASSASSVASSLSSAASSQASLPSTLLTASLTTSLPSGVTATFSTPTGSAGSTTAPVPTATNAAVRSMTGSVLSGGVAMLAIAWLAV